MNELLTYLLEASICLTASLVFYRVVLSELTFFSLNRGFLLSMLAISLMIPAISIDFALFQNNGVIQEVTLPLVWVGDQVANNQNAFDLNWLQLIGGIYLLGVLFTASRLILGFFQSFNLLGKSNLLFYQNQMIAVHPDFSPASFFQYILLPEFHMDDEDQQRIILHESVHVKKKHSWDLLFLQLAKTVFWFNPLIYIYENSIREVHEFQADQGVTQSYSQSDYSRLLLRLLTAGRGWQFMNNFNQFQTKKRIIMMNKTKSQSKEKSRFLWAVPVLGLLFFAFSCDLAQVDEELEGPVLNGEKEVAVGITDLKARITDVGKDGGEIFDIVETMPNPPGGMEGWNEYLANNLSYPDQARRMGVEGTVIVRFVVNKDGSVSNAEILRGIGAGADEEAMRVVQNSPDWTPGNQRGRAVNTRMRLPIRFMLGNGEVSREPSQVKLDSPEEIEIPISN
ncbi:outer membrane transport energization protein TonB [Algoriphagus halophilus]|uniref:Outer membrane transport energization protein TonB n=1 Tax=Algoriphagus halophilus TaxID=226505 RepID=A0A1N6DJT5_9BACT|nr:outer membrane transport energization protein TonB [Algoriphagus halophilus]